MNKYYLIEMFEPTLLYGVSLAVLGVAAAFYYRHFSLLYAVLVIFGALFAQMSVNVISDYFDYKSGLDKELSKKKSDQLSGGSSLIANGSINPEYTLLSGIVAFSIAAIIGLYLITVRIQLLPILIFAAFTIFLYARYVKKVPYLSEPLCTLNYTLIALGSFIAVAGFSAFSYNVMFALVPAGIILGGNALFVNEVPDRLLDKKFGVKHSAVMLHTRERIGSYYLGLQSLAYAIIIIGVIIRALPPFALISVFTLPSTIYVFRGLYYADSKRYGKYLSVHTIYAVVVAIILSIAYIFPVLL
jgi:1,4-dihydroxy-2-naphthoate polyprenyltransferase